MKGNLPMFRDLPALFKWAGSMARVIRILVCSACVSLAGCATHPTFVKPNAPITKAAAVQRVYLATSRLLAADLAGTTERAAALSFAQYDITVPPGHKPGTLELSATNPDPAQVFTVADARGIATLAEFGSIVRSQTGPSRKPLDSTVIYVHGFNTSLESSVYQRAQIAYDYSLVGPQVTFSWPSIQRLGGYVRDKDSILLARDSLVELLIELTRGGEKIFLFGHSMGTQLVVETLRQLSISGQQNVLRHIGGVILISPDIDIDLFETMYKRINPLPQPFVVMSTEHDYALRFSALLTGESERLGSVKDRDRLASLDILVLDLSGLPNSRDHFLAASSPVVIDIVNRARKADATNPFPRRGIIDVAAMEKAALVKSTARTVQLRDATPTDDPGL
jgi:esterase/lipase superfamily enzyme